MLACLLAVTSSLSEASAGFIRNASFHVALALHLILLELFLAEGDMPLSGMVIEFLAAPLALNPIVVLLRYSCSLEVCTSAALWIVIIRPDRAHGRSEHL